MTKKKFLFAALTVVCFCASSLTAEVIYSIQSGNWNSASTWITADTVVNRVPQASDTVYIQPGHTVDVDTSGVGDELVVGINWLSGEGILNIKAGAVLDITNNVYFGIGGTAGTIVQTGGSLDIGAYMSMGTNYADTGASYYSISGSSTLDVGAGTYLGYYNDSEFAVSGSSATITVGTSFISEPNDVSASATMTFDIASTGISTINTGSYVGFHNDQTSFNLSGGVPGNNYSLFSIAPGTAYRQAGFGDAQVNNPSLYNVIAAPGSAGEFEIIANLNGCLAEYATDLNDDCLVTYEDFAIVAQNWAWVGVEQ